MPDLPAARRPGFFARHPVLARSIWRRVFLAANPVVFSTVHVNEYPKSGGTWLCRMLRDLTGWRFDDNSYPRPGKSIVKHHRLGLKMTRGVTLIRDPRDVVVSFFHHSRKVFDGDGFNAPARQLAHQYIFGDAKDSETQLRRFVETVETKPIVPAYTWRDFYQRALDQGAPILRYEDLRTEPQDTLARIARHLGLDCSDAKIQHVADQHRIENVLAARGAESGHHFIRRGKIGGFADELPPDLIEMIQRNNADLMERFEYH